MREIKFRAQIKNALYLMPVVTIDFVNGIEVQDIHDERLDLYFYEWKDVEALEQWTGLTDKNGTMIFEGDLVRGVYSETLEEVEWNSNDAGFFPFTSPSYGGYEWDSLNPKRSIVVGNIHQNPELLSQA